MKLRIAYKICGAFTFAFWSTVLIAVLAYFNLSRLADKLASGKMLDITSTNSLVGEYLNKLIWEMGIVVVIVLIISLFITVYLIRNVINPVKSLTNLTKQIASGDFTQKAKNLEVIQTNDELEELGVALREMYRTLKKFLFTLFIATDKMVETSNQVNRNTDVNLRAIEQVTLAIQQISLGSNEQAIDLQNTSTMIGKLDSVIDTIKHSTIQQNQNVYKTVNTINQMSTAIDKVVANTRRITNETENTFKAASDGKSLVDETIEDMKNINELVDKLADKITSLGVRSQQIGEIVQVIEDIAEQTNLLALNAAIEAARAGEHGKGFAVVADEVRKLAENSRKSTGEIRNLILGIQTETNSVIEEMNKATSDVEEGTEVAYRAGSALREIIEAVNKLLNEVSEITTAMDSMKIHGSQVVDAVQGIAQITDENGRITDELTDESKKSIDSIMNVSSISEENAAATQEVNASAEEVSSANHEMRTQIEELNQLITELQTESKFYRLR